MAYRRVRDIGVCLLEERKGKLAEVRFVDPERELGLKRPPSAEQCAEAINNFCHQHEIRVLLLDGPQGWKDRDTELKYCRACERVLHTPGKVGVDEDHVKPPSWKRFAKFSIDVFAKLVELGAVRVTEPIVGSPSGALLVVESFPTSAWWMLGIQSLPAKAKASEADIKNRFEALRKRFAFRVEGDKAQPSHDDLQALVAGLAGVAILAGNPGGFVAVGLPPRTKKGVTVEGYIVNPRLEAQAGM